MRRLELSFGEVHHIKHIGRESESVAELLDGNGRGDGKQIIGLADGEIDEGQTGECHASRHPPNGFLQSDTRCKQSAQDTAYGEEYHSDSAIHNTYFCRGKFQTSCLFRSYQERHTHLDEECFGQAIKQHECDGQPYAGFGEVSGKCAPELLEYGFCRCQHRLVRGRLGYCKEVIESYQTEHDGCNQHCDGP